VNNATLALTAVQYTLADCDPIGQAQIISCPMGKAPNPDTKEGEEGSSLMSILEKCLSCAYRSCCPDKAKALKAKWLIKKRINDSWTKGITETS
jgi:hypothetical protein